MFMKRLCLKSFNFKFSLNFKLVTFDYHTSQISFSGVEFCGQIISINECYKAPCLVILMLKIVIIMCENRLDFLETKTYNNEKK